MRFQKILAITFVAMIFANQIFAQSGPAWLQQGDLVNAKKIWCFLEIPNTGIILAGGRGYYKRAAIWKSTNNGQTWEQKLNNSYTDEGVRQFAFDENKNIIFACVSNYWSYLEWKPIWYSTDLGESWNYISQPAALGNRAQAHSIVILNNKLYVAFQDDHSENGNDNWGIYSADLYRLDISNPNSSYWYWEHCMHYPELDYIMRLAINNDKIYVFGKDRNTNGIRIFTYDPESMGKNAQFIGKLDEIKKEIKLLQNEEAKSEQEKNINVPPINDNKGEVR